MNKSNAIQIVCGDYYSAKINFAGDLHFDNPYLSFEALMDENNFHYDAQSQVSGSIIFTDSEGTSHVVSGKALPINGNRYVFNIPITDGKLLMPDFFTRAVIPVKTDYDIFGRVNVTADDTESAAVNGIYTPIYRNVIEFLPRTNRILVDILSDD